MEKSSKKIYIVALLLFIFGVGYMVWSGISQNSVYFLNVSEALAMDQNELKSARLFGTVSNNNLELPKSRQEVKFQLIDAENNNNYIVVTYSGTIPDTFEAGVEVIVEGKMQDNAFFAKTLMTKCPSKYEKENREKKA